MINYFVSSYARDGQFINVIYLLQLFLIKMKKLDPHSKRYLR